MAVDDSYTVLLLHGNGVDGATSFVDEAGKIVTPVGNTCIKTDQSRFGGASMFFDGSGDSLTVGTSTDFAFGIGDFTIDMWINASVFGTNGIFFAISATGGLIFGRRETLDSWGICAWGGSVWGVTATPLPSLNTWHHLAMVRATGILTLYLDGIAVASGTDVRSYVGGAATIGLNGFTGYIDEVRVSKGIARWTENFIPADTAYTSLTLYPDDASSVLLLHANGPDGHTLFIDETGKQLTTNGLAFNSSIKRKFGISSAYFDGGHLKLANSEDFNFGLGDFTIDAWVYKTTSNSYPAIIASNLTSWANGAVTFLMDLPSGKVRFAANNNGTLIEAFGPIWTNNQWLHIAVVRVAGYLTVFVNGVGGTSVNFSTIPIAFNANNGTVIGGDLWDGANGLYHGYIDALRVSKGIARWTENFTPPTSAYGARSDAPIGDAQILLTGSGGGGGSGAAGAYEGGGGGAGGFIETVLELSAGVYPITIGVGGPPNLAGAPSTFGSLLHAFAGGYGGGPSGAAGGPGASGGGSRANGAAGITIAPEQGNNGGGGVNPSGGGGGANGVGASGGSRANGAPGGPGKVSTISGSSKAYSGGGGGAATTNGTGGLGGSSVGGNGANWGLVGNAAVPNTGSGGGGGSSSGSKLGGSGASGVCIIRYLSGSINGSGGTVTFDGDYVIHTFTSSGVFIASAVREYVSEGIAVFGPYILPTMVEEPLSSLLSWSAIVPVNTFAMVDIAIVDTVPVDTDYIPTVNGGAIPDLTMASSEKKLFVRVTMSTSDVNVTPMIEALYYEIVSIPSKAVVALSLTDIGRLKNPEGSILVNYSKSLGNLVGLLGGQVNTFSDSFLPLITNKVFCPNDVENIQVTITQTVVDMHVDYLHVKEEENISAEISQLNVLYHINNIPT